MSEPSINAEKYLDFEGNSSLLEPLLAKGESSTQADSVARMAGVSIVPIGSKSQGYHLSQRSGGPTDFVTKGASATARISPEASSSFPQKNSLLKNLTKTVSSFLSNNSQSDLALRSEAELQDKKIIEDAVQLACCHLKNDNEYLARNTIEKELMRTERFYFYGDKPYEIKKEIENLLTVARGQIMKEARQKALNLLKVDSHSRDTADKARKELEVAIRQTTPSEKYTQLSQNEMDKQQASQVIDLLIEIKKELEN